MRRWTSWRSCPDLCLLATCDALDLLKGTWALHLPRMHKPGNHVRAAKVVHVVAARTAHELRLALLLLVGAEHAPKGVGQRVVVLRRPKEVERLHRREEHIELLVSRPRTISPMVCGTRDIGQERAHARTSACAYARTRAELARAARDRPAGPHQNKDECLPGCARSDGVRFDLPALSRPKKPSSIPSIVGPLPRFRQLSCETYEKCKSMEGIRKSVRVKS